MIDPVEALAEKVDAIGQKLDAHASSVGARFDAVDARFDEVTSALVEQRQYTEFAFDRLRSEMTAGFSAMTANFARLERKLDLLIDRMAGGHSGA
ncbi:MAG TPA: hypothetical protein VFO14_06005 [Vicinamibacterales bacterium]|nr:hypothetical protein [Vicinamibacterales bacterium]